MSSTSTPSDQPGPGDRPRVPAQGSPSRPSAQSAPTASASPSAARSGPEPVLRLEELTRVHGSGATEVHALRGIDLDVFPGELVAVMGPSGSGKSTLLTIAGGLDLPTSGRVVVEGTDLSAASRKELAALRRRSIGYVFQDYNLIPALTAAENVALPRELDGVSTRRARKEALAALEEMGLGHLADRFPDEMSGGQQQRVAIARALVGDRRLVLADEPTGALDSETGEAVLALLRTRCDAGAAGVLVTHEPRFAAWADRVVFLRDGSVVDMTLRSSAESLLTGGAAS
ncbi:ABC transporter ATP-binding protein [Streptomyces sp. PLK6-54]|uniref:ABC transporter ATP-binding protein n=1 Tax=Actinacidiphila acidipaludis TaxID=2873382 RepID=A0ABS7QCP4_9ACTN|nr:ABC transporter ATP-binding protein [Streptomyces acidipaludis]